jgi:hypothetical protein
VAYVTNCDFLSIREAKGQTCGGCWRRSEHLLDLVFALGGAQLHQHHVALLFADQL